MPSEANEDPQEALDTLQPLIDLYGKSTVRWLVDLPIWPLPKVPLEPASEPAKPASEDLLRTLETLQPLITRHGRTKVNELIDSHP